MVLKWVHPRSPGWALNPVTSVLFTAEEKTQGDKEEGHVKMEAETEVMQPQAKDTRSRQNLEDST